MRHLRLLCLLFTLLCLPARAEDTAPTPAPEADPPGYSQAEILDKAETFFGDVSEGLAKAIARVFEDQGQPSAFITGEEFSGAIGIGARYGRGELSLVDGASQAVFWQGPSIGFDLGGDASKVFTLVYGLDQIEDIFQRYPGVDGSYFVVGGAGVNYLRSGDTVLAPIRTGVGVRAGASVGYLHFTREKSWIPF